VNSYDVATRTCDCTAITGMAGTDMPNVQLMPEVDDGLVLFPTAGSTVFVVYSTYVPPFVVLFSQIDQVLFSAGSIQFNDGSFGGLTKSIELQTQLNTTNALLTAILTVLNGAPIPEPGSGSPSALQAALKVALTGQQLGDYSAIINTLITHGV
jgi:hypothetical protein